jgi:hypothetical protein
VQFLTGQQLAGEEQVVVRVADAQLVGRQVAQDRPDDVGAQREASSASAAVATRNPASVLGMPM